MMFPRALLLAIGLLGASVAQAVPSAVEHQGRLLDTAGTPLEGSAAVTFSLFNAPGATTPVWSDTLAVELRDGFYAVQLSGVSEHDDTTQLDAELIAAHSTLYLGVAVGSTELSREELTAAPYALVAERAETIARTDCQVGDVLAWSGEAWECSRPGTTTFVRWGRTVCPSTSTRNSNCSSTSTSFAGSSTNSIGWQHYEQQQQRQQHRSHQHKRHQHKN